MYWFDSANLMKTKNPFKPLNADGTMGWFGRDLSQK